jgi:hypothetical protein
MKIILEEQREKTKQEMMEKQSKKQSPQLLF